jgi:hypothetical protein
MYAGNFESESAALTHFLPRDEMPSAPIRLDPGIISPNFLFPGSIPTVILVQESSGPQCKSDFRPRSRDSGNESGQVLS